MEKGGGVGTRPHFVYNFHGEVACWKRYNLDSILKREYIFGEF